MISYGHLSASAARLLLVIRDSPNAVPSTAVLMEASGIRKRKTFYDARRELEQGGFVLVGGSRRTDVQLVQAMGVPAPSPIQAHEHTPIQLVQQAWSRYMSHLPPLTKSDAQKLLAYEKNDVEAVQWFLSQWSERAKSVGYIMKVAYNKANGITPWKVANMQSGTRKGEDGWEDATEEADDTLLADIRRGIAQAKAMGRYD